MKPKFECMDCGWQGTTAQKKVIFIDLDYGLKQKICPACDCREFVEVERVTVNN